MRTSPVAAARRGRSWQNPNLLSALLMAVVLPACEPGQLTLVEPEAPDQGETILDVHVKVADSVLAEELGWEEGVPASQAEWAYVHHMRYLFRSAESDRSGVIQIEPEGAGYHWIAAQREVEIDGVSRVLGGGAKALVSTDLSLRLDDPGTVVISEVYMDAPPSWETAGMGYHGSKYIELYNNSTAVLYLDGMVLGIAYNFWWDSSRNGHHPCSYTRPFREDPDAVWSASHWRFPGSGIEHPIAPGEAVVVAVSAADHTDVHASMLDLSHAGFELAGEGSADNPAAANLENVSTPGRRNQFLIGTAFWFVSDPVGVDGLSIMTDDDSSRDSGIDYRRFPAEQLLDVAVMWWDATSDPVISRDSPPCEHPIHPSFDALPGGYLYGATRPEDLLVSPQRRVIRTRGGQPVLLDTNTSAVDFENVTRTPGWIPGTAASATNLDGRR